MNINSSIEHLYKIELTLNKQELFALIDMLQNSWHEDEENYESTFRAKLYNELKSISQD